MSVILQGFGDNMISQGYYLKENSPVIQPRNEPQGMFRCRINKNGISIYRYVTMKQFYANCLNVEEKNCSGRSVAYVAAIVVCNRNL